MRQCAMPMRRHPGKPASADCSLNRITVTGIAGPFTRQLPGIWSASTWPASFYQCCWCTCGWSSRSVGRPSKPFRSRRTAPILGPVIVISPFLPFWPSMPTNSFKMPFQIYPPPDGLTPTPPAVTDDRPVRRLLFLLPFAPRLDAVHGGSRTTAQLLVPLAQRHRVALLYLRGPGEPPVDDGLRSHCEFVEEVARDAGSALTQRLLHRLRVVGSMLRGKPEWVSEWTVPSYEIRLRALARTWQPDIVQVEYHVMGQYLPALRDCAAPRVLIQHDPGAAAARQRHQLSHGIRQLRSYLGARAWQHYEQDIMRQVQAIIVFTERDRKALAPVVGRVPIIRIPIGTILPARPLDPVGQL